MPRLLPCQAITKLDKAGVEAAIRAGADLNARNAAGDTPLLYIAREVRPASAPRPHALARAHGSLSGSAP
jgi:ankyrin repeat protein